MDDTGPGLRERKKRATKRALHEAAMRLALRDGYDQLTVEAVADAATVSRRTFSNYFAGKEEALLHGERTRLARLLAAVAARPADERPWAALTAAIHDEVREFDAEAGPAWLAQARLIRSHPDLLAEQIATFASFERDLAEHIDHRTPPELRSRTGARVIAGCFLTALRVGTQAWVDGPEEVSLPELVEQALAEAGRELP